MSLGLFDVWAHKITAIRCDVAAIGNNVNDSFIDALIDHKARDLIEWGSDELWYGVAKLLRGDKLDPATHVSLADLPPGPNRAYQGKHELPSRHSDAYKDSPHHLKPYHLRSDENPDDLDAS